MALVSSSPTSLTPEGLAEPGQASSTATIDGSARGPLALLIGSAAVWLLISSLLALVSSWKLHSPDFLGGIEALTYGRVHPAQTNAFIYGWGFNAGMGIALWLVARLSKAPVQGGLLLTVAVIFWNLGVTLGIAGIFIGDSSSLTWLEMPRYATPVLFVAYTMVAVWTLLTFRAGRMKNMFASQWYIFAALFWFPWLYSVAQVLLLFVPVRGTLQSVVNNWFVHNLYALWFTPIGLAVIYYLVPKILGKEIRDYYLAPLGFWWLTFFGSISGAAALIGGPVPAWLQTTGIGSNWMLLVPLFILIINFFGTLSGSYYAVKGSYSLRFTVIGATAFALSLGVAVLLSIRSIAAVTQFTFVTPALIHLGLYGFFSMVIFGAMYFGLPRITAREWRSPGLIRLHFWAALVGMLMAVGGLSLGGIQQGNLMLNPDVSFIQITGQVKPYLLVSFLGSVLQLVGHVALALNLLGLFVGSGSRVVANFSQPVTSEEIAR